jgi:hypothetical protein
MEMKSLYHQQVYNRVLERIEKITPEATPVWGKMTAAQMMAHCAEVMDVSNG